MDRTPPKPVCHCLQRLFQCRTSGKHCSPQIAPRRWEASIAFLKSKASSFTASSSAQFFLFLLCVFAISSARADVIVLANRTPAPVGFRFVPNSGQAQQLTL